MPRGQEKARRMELQRELGLRKPRPRAAPRTPQSGSYLVAHVCFACRITRKLEADPTGKPRVCSKCRGPLHWMGRSFRAPRRGDEEQWMKVQTLFAHGFRFFSYRSYDCTPLPSRLVDVADFVRLNPKHPFKVAESDDRLLPTKRSRKRASN